MVVCRSVDGVDWPVVTNVFASRARVARLLESTEDRLHLRFHELASHRMPMSVLDDGPVLGVVETGSDIDVRRLPMLRHFAQDAAPYWTSAVIVPGIPSRRGQHQLPR